ncbi:S-adenosyl-L-methionine-dependent methyltransferase [Dactylonectria macrodidyma]|uniref:tRNA wybutosine-synthesizing protein 4 n=1 Tax=Dactylonectria macrodidyma TaxID=307937 RepID=A0A9P9J7Y0_9HYPO|nr:S-adenosyl-L-methionine-dependent methyltransferase [Dactylonectria macrodidyma]
MTTSSSKHAPSPRQPKSQALDDLIMGTNSSSIVSKRSVERLYYPNEAHFFRYFVNKFQRRAPLINRGYWLRLRAIDVVVHKFLKSSPSDRKKVVINLGCGSDVLPWQCQTRYASECENTVFLDIDYPDLMRKKRAIVLGTPQLCELLGPNHIISERDTDQILLRSDKYCQLGCDLRKLDALRQCLESFLPLSECSVLFVAEVSITYMDTLSADALIKWASSIGQAEFCLLEQILPNGPDHPFARTMLSHFNKLNTPLKSVHTYPTLESQTTRFKKRGWHNVDLWDLWEAWNSEEFLSPAERIALDDVEPFDEWEEFVLFARHYFVMHAIASPSTRTSPHDRRQQDDRSLAAVEICQHDVVAPKRRFGASMAVTSPEGQPFCINAFGMGISARVASCDVYTLEGRTMPLEMSPVGPSARMCHTSTDLGSFGILLAGGRASPSGVVSDCWVFKKDTKYWQKTDDLPTPLFRHAAVRLRGSALALVLGGRVGPSQVSPDYFLFHPTKGWLRCATSGSVPDPTFGAVAISSSEESQNSLRVFRGLLTGGMTRDGAINTKAYGWTLDVTGAVPSLNFELIEELGSQGHGLAVFGAQVVDCGSLTAVCGGVGQQQSSQGQDIAFVSLSEGLQVHLSAPSENTNHKWPLMIGSSVVALRNQLVLLGGGATCFSMGTYWETGVYSVDASDISSSHGRGPPGQNMSISYVDSPKLTQFSGDLVEQTQVPAKATLKAIARVRLDSDSDFQQVLQARKPVIIEGLDLGQCVENWTPEYMVHRLGEKKEVVVHECQLDTEKMDFNSKNFRYVTDTFESFMNKAKLGQRLYLRSLSEKKPSEAPANIITDFPLLADECSLPKELRHVTENLFSSVLRISGKVNMWLHYDVMANVYAQVRGSKRMVLFPPTDVSHLAFAPGASSSSLDVFSALEKHQLAGSHPHEAVLGPGDVLFLPPMWFHTATPTTDMSVAVNFFFRDLHTGYSSGRDVYGNRDLAAYEKGRQDVARIAKGFDQVPLEIRQFYLARLADELLHHQA